MIARIWRTGVDMGREREYAAFEQEHSLPMFLRQPGLVGVLFLRSPASAAVLTLWEKREDVERLAESLSYRGTVARLRATGLLRGEQIVEVFEVVGGRIHDARWLATVRRPPAHADERAEGPAPQTHEVWPRTEHPLTCRVRLEAIGRQATGGAQEGPRGAIAHPRGALLRGGWGIARAVLQIVVKDGRHSERLDAGTVWQERTPAIGAWIFQIARSAIADHYRTASVRRERPLGTEVEQEETPASEPAAADLRSELTACLGPLLQQLPGIHREALRLTELDGLTQASAAKQLGLSASGMKSRVQRARARLKALLVDCCEIELDRRGGVISYGPRPGGCECHGGDRRPAPGVGRFMG